MKKRIQAIKEEYGSYSKFEKRFVIFAMLVSFFVHMEASIVKAVSNSLFITSYTVSYLPYVWLASVPFNFLLVHYYNRWIGHVGPVRMQSMAVGLAAMISLIAAYYVQTFSWMPFFLYMWKDVFILLMLQQLWSVLHSTITTSRAKYLYGMIFGMGGLGSAVGATIPGFFAVKFGSAHLLLTTLPLYLFIFGFYLACIRTRNQFPYCEPLSFKVKTSNFKEGVSLILGSPYLKYILLLVAFMQVISTLLDFNFNTMLQQAIHSQDLRTEFLGRMFGVVNTLNIALQFLGVYVVVRLIGVEKSHLSIPLYFLLSVACFAIFPAFSLIVFTYASVKSLDYSLFSVLKEMLYIPLKIDEKFKAKAVIDVFIYRTAKALASFSIIVLQILFPYQVTLSVSLLVMVFCAFWCLSIPRLFLEYKKIKEA